MARAPCAPGSVLAAGRATGQRVRGLRGRGRRRRRPGDRRSGRAAARRRCSLLVRVAQVHGHAPTLLHLLDLFESEGRVQARALELHEDGGDALGLAEGARLEGLLLLADVARDIEGVALAVTEAVEDGAAAAALLAHRLPQRLRLAPVTLEVLALGDHQRLLAGRQHLLDLLLPSLRVVAAAVLVGRGDGARRPVLAGLRHLHQHGHQAQGQGQLPEHPATREESEGLAGARAGALTWAQEEKLRAGAAAAGASASAGMLSEIPPPRRGGGHRSREYKRTVRTQTHVEQLQNYRARVATPVFRSADNS